MRIAFLIPDEYVPALDYFRPFLTPDGTANWGDTQFTINPQDGEFDGIVVFQSVNALSRRYKLVCPSNRTLLAVAEPPDIAWMPSGYIEQFHKVLCQDHRISRSRRILSHSGHHWFVEVPFMMAEQNLYPQKSKLLSAVVSNKTTTRGHRARLAFLQALKARFGDDFDWYGRGVRELGSQKLEGLERYKYHLVLENGSWPHYWTEKLADAYMANCMPIYWGAPNISEYFSPSSMISINVDRIPESIDRIEAAISRNAYCGAQTALAQARRKLLFDYHPYQAYLRILQRQPAGSRVMITIKPHSEFRFAFKDKIVGRVWRFQNRKLLRSQAVI